MTRTTDPHPPSALLIAGLVFTLLVICGHAAHTLHSVHRMRALQTSIVERNRLASLQLIRIQNDLNALALAMRDMLDRRDGQPVIAWRPALKRIQENLEDAVRREAALSEGQRTAQETAYLQTTFQDFWRTTSTILTSGWPEDQAHRAIRDSLQPRQEALTALVARLLVENNDKDSRAGRDVNSIYLQIERSAYLYLAVSLVLIAVTSLTLIRANRRLFSRLEGLATQRRELAQQLITTQEATLRSISRDLHDEFGQILTGLGAMLQRAGRRAQATEFHQDIRELATVVQETLDKIRSLSQSLQPVILEEQGLLAAVQWHISVFERHSRIKVNARLPREPVTLPPDASIHVFRILQEALNNVARHAGVDEVNVTLDSSDVQFRLVVEDSGPGIRAGSKAGIGLAAMRERAELIGGHCEIGKSNAGGATISLTVPLAAAHPAGSAPPPSGASPSQEVEVG